jgi:hypothetical protein
MAAARTYEVETMQVYAIYVLKITCAYRHLNSLLCTFHLRKSWYLVRLKCTGQCHKPEASEIISLHVLFSLVVFSSSSVTVYLDS